MLKLSCSGWHLLHFADAGGVVRAFNSLSIAVDCQCICSAIECLSIGQSVRRGELSVLSKL